MISEYIFLTTLSSLLNKPLHIHDISPFASIIPTHTYISLSLFQYNNLIFVTTLAMISELFFSSPVVTTLVY